MVQLVQENWILLVIALVVAILVVWWILAANRRTKVEIESQDGGEPAPARRNQALIDAPPAAAPVPPPAPVGLAGAGEAAVAGSIAMPPVQEPEPAPLSVAPLPVDPAPLNAPPVEPDEAGPAPMEPAPVDAVPPAPTVQPAPSQPAPQAGAQAAPVTSAPTGAEELTRIKGLGPKLAEQLRALGVTSLAQIAAWDDAEIDRVDAQLGRFQGRIRRDNWPEQARLLTGSDLSAYEARFGKL